MPADIGHGAAGFTNVVTKSGNDFRSTAARSNFVRNAAFDARKFFDHSSPIDPRRIPPFARNEFGVTNGGPIVLAETLRRPRQNILFRRVSRFPPSSGHDAGLRRCRPRRSAKASTRRLFRATRYSSRSVAKIAPILARYPLPNEPRAPTATRTYAASSKVVTNTDQFSIRVDHKISDKANLFTRFSLNQVNGPTTNPDQTAIDPDFRHQVFRSPAKRRGAIHANRLSAT